MDSFSRVGRVGLLALVGLLVGLAYASVLSLVALAGYAIRGPELFQSLGVTLRETLSAYFAGGAIAGVVAVTLGYHVRSPFGAVAVGAIAAAPLILSVFVALEGWPLERWNWLGVGVLSLVFGYFCGRAVWDEHQKAHQGR